MEYIKRFNLALRFIIEIIIVFIVGYWGFNNPKSLLVKIICGIGLSILIIFIWGVFGSPKAPIKLNVTMRLVLEIILITIGTLELYYTKFGKFTVLFGIIAFSNLALMYLWKQN